MDLTDIIDFKGGVASIGVGAKVEVTDYLGGGLGVGLLPVSGEFFGRRSERSGCFFLHLGFIGTEAGFSEISEQSILLFHGTYPGHEHRIPLHSRFRVGGEVVLPVISFGAYLNFGELMDFFLGFGGLDIAADDGVQKGTALWSFTMVQGISKYDEDLAEAIEQLKVENISQKEEAIEKLGEMHAIHAMDELIKVLESDYPSSTIEKAAKAMEKITGLDYGTDAAAWRGWWDVE